MQLNQIQPKNRGKKSRRVGRGGKRGSYSGKGSKGQKARAGHRLRPELRDIIKKIPKKRGYRFKSVSKSAVVVNLSAIETRFKKGKITPVLLVKAGLIKKEKGKIPEVKILGEGKITKKLEITGCVVSGVAKEKIEKAGGSIK